MMSGIVLRVVTVQLVGDIMGVGLVARRVMVTMSMVVPCSVNMLVRVMPVAVMHIHRVGLICACWCGCRWNHRGTCTDA